MDQGQVSGVAEHEDDEGDEVQAGQGLRQAFMISGQAPEAGGPGEAAIDHPPARQQNETAKQGEEAHEHHETPDRKGAVPKDTQIHNGVLGPELHKHERDD